MTEEQVRDFLDTALEQFDDPCGTDTYAVLRSFVRVWPEWRDVAIELSPKYVVGEWWVEQ